MDVIYWMSAHSLAELLMGSSLISSIDMSLVMALALLMFPFLNDSITCLSDWMSVTGMMFSLTDSVE